ncbi:MAG: hypothetical protein ACRCV3_06135 [Desulfovibrionaceae bacterium]
MSFKKSPLIIKKALIISLFCIILLCIYFIARPFLNDEQTSLVEDVDFLNAVTSINAELPLMIDEETELMSIQFTNKVLQYHFRLPLIDKASMQVTPFKEKMLSQFKKAYCGQEEIMVLLRQRSYAVSYIYKDKNYTIITDFFLEPQDCPKT